LDINVFVILRHHPLGSYCGTTGGKYLKAVG